MNSTFLNSNSIMDRGPQVYQLIQLSRVTLVKQRRLFYYLRCVRYSFTFDYVGGGEFTHLYSI
jgi:hypothetical protein